jgi:hypothetical protein
MSDDMSVDLKEDSLATVGYQVNRLRYKVREGVQRGKWARSPLSTRSGPDRRQRGDRGAPAAVFPLDVRLDTKLPLARDLAEGVALKRVGLVRPRCQTDRVEVVRPRVGQSSLRTRLVGERCSPGQPSGCDFGRGSGLTSQMHVARLTPCASGRPYQYSSNEL